LPISFLTSVLGGQDWRYATDFQLAPPLSNTTQFGNTSKVVLPTTTLQYRWTTLAGVNADPNTNAVTNWADRISGAFLQPTAGNSAYLLYSGIVEKAVITTTPSILSLNPATGNTGTIAILFGQFTTSADALIYDNGSVDISFEYNHTLGKFTAFTSAVSNITPTNNTWYIAILTPVDGTVKIYNPITQNLLDIFSSSSSVVPNSQILTGNNVALAEVIIYNTDLSDSDISSVLGYLSTVYFTSFALPLTFPDPKPINTP